MAVLLLMAGTQLAAGQQSGCLPPGTTSAKLLESAVRMATEDSIPEMIAHRNRLGILPVPASEVELITDDQTCNHAATVFQRVTGLNDRAPAVDVVRVGTRYMVVDATFKNFMHVAKSTPLVVLDEQLNVLRLVVDTRLVVSQVDASTLDEWFSCLEEQTSAHPTECVRWWRVRKVVESPHEYHAATVDAVLDRLVRLALTTDNQQLQISTTHSLSRAGRKPNHHPGVVDRLEALFWQSDAPAVKLMVANVMLDQAETSRAVEFLEAMAQETEDQYDLAHYAIKHLEGYGDQGRAVLQRLYDQGSVTNARASWLLSRTLEKENPD